MDHIALVSINDKEANYGVATGYSSLTPDIYMGLLDAYLERQGIPIDLIDAEADGLSFEETITRVIEPKPVLIGLIASGVNVSASTMSMVAIIRVAKALVEKKGNIKVFIQGGHPTVMPERTLLETQADFVVIGEGYETIEKLYANVTSNLPIEQVPGLVYQSIASNGIFEIIKHPPPALVDVEKLPQINWGKMNPKKYRAHNWHCFGEENSVRTPYAVVWTSMGCPFPCEFCCINNVFEKRTFRFRSMTSVMKEIDVLVHDYNIRHLRIHDELFIIKHPRLTEFCELLEQRRYDLNIWCYARVDSVEPKILKRLKNVGVNWIGYGFETGDDEEALESVKKKVKKHSYSNKEVIDMTRDAGINIIGHAIFGLWDDDEASIRRNYQFLRKYEFEWNNIYPAFAYPGTPLYDQYIEQKRISVPERWDGYGLYSYECCPLPTKHLSSAQVLRLRDELFQDYYSDPNILNNLEKKFGRATRQELEEMAGKRVSRRLLEE